MLNVEEFGKRLKLVMDYYELSAALLAEKMKVQRSSISHILSGRNKPSLEFVLKILKSFPDVEFYWLLNGVGKFPKKKGEFDPDPTLFTGNRLDEVSDIDTTLKKTSEIDSSIERIVIFYKNGSFKDYTA